MFARWYTGVVAVRVYLNQYCASDDGLCFIRTYYLLSAHSTVIYELKHTI